MRKDSEEQNRINRFIQRVAKERGLSQADIVKRIAERKKADPNLYKGIVNKWFKEKQEPGKAYLLDLAAILDVSVESILKGEYTPSLELRPTAYNAALTGNKDLIDRLFKNGVSVFDEDEYYKSFIDYVLEFHNYPPLKYVFDEGYYSVHSLSLADLSNHSDPQKALALLKMIVEADDIEHFCQIYHRISFIAPLDQQNTFQYAWSIPDNLCDDILKSNKILNLFTDISPLTEKEKKELNSGVQANLNFNLGSIPSLTQGFNMLLNRAIQSGNEKKESLMNVAMKYINSVEVLCEPYYQELQVSENGALRVKGHTKYTLAFVPVISGEDESMQAKEIKDFCNRFK